MSNDTGSRAFEHAGAPDQHAEAAAPSSEPSTTPGHLWRRRLAELPMPARLVAIAVVAVLAVALLWPDPPPPKPRLISESTKGTIAERANGERATGERATDGSAPTGLVDRLEASTVYIRAQGSFVEPEGPYLDAHGFGSGFVVDSSGLVVTNNHVVAGAGLVQVWFAGDDEPRSADVLGVSECSDLAVIDIAGSGFPSLSWRQGKVPVGTDVFAAGYPLGDPEFTLTRGIVSKAQTAGDTGWASVDGVLEHDARINPGSSGGPLVSSDGDVIAVNYAGDPDHGQFFAIAGGPARDVVDRLAEGKDIDSIGINGTAFELDTGQTGIWVASVVTGSPADEVGVRPGDIVTRLEGLEVGAEGTMRTYCDILRSHDADDQLSIEVVRTSTREVLEGRLNGARLSPVAVADGYPTDEPAGSDEGDLPSDEAPAEGYRALSDVSGTISLRAPSGWQDVNGNHLGDGSPALSVALDVEDFKSVWGSAGAMISVVADPAADPVQLLGDWADQCTPVDEWDYSEGAYDVLVDEYSDCGGTSGQHYLRAVLKRPGDARWLLVEVQTVGDRAAETGWAIVDSARYVS
jgi:serine protease Do